MPKPTPQPTPVPTPVPTPEPTTTTTTTTTTVATCSNVDGKGTPFDCGGMEFNDYSKGSEDPNEGVCCIPTTTTTSTTPAPTPPPPPTPAPTPCECESCTTTSTTSSTATTSTSTTTFTTTPKDHWAAEFDAAYADLGRLLTTNLRCSEGCLGDQLEALRKLRAELTSQVGEARQAVARHEDKEKQL